VYIAVQQKYIAGHQVYIDVQQVFVDVQQVYVAVQQMYIAVQDCSLYNAVTHNKQLKTSITCMAKTTFSAP